MKKLMKSQETLTVQAGTNGSSCYCRVKCSSNPIIHDYDSYNDIQKDAAFSGNPSPFSLTEKE